MSDDFPDTSTLLGKNLPRTLTLPNGDQITFEWEDEEVVSDESKQAPPFGRYRYLSTRQFFRGKKGNSQKTFPALQDTLTYDANEDTYKVEEPDINPGSVVVTATVGGAQTILVEDVDYVVEHQIGYYTLGQIRFLSTGDNPDDATQFTIDYETIKLNEARIDRPFITYRLTLHVPTLENGENGATRYYTHSRLAKLMGEALARELIKLRGSDLHPTGGGRAKLGTILTLGALPTRKGESLSRWGIDIMIKATHAIPMTAPVERIGSHEVEAKAE